MSKSVVVVDDHSLIAEALSNIIERFHGFHVLYEAENGKVLMEKFKHPKHIPDIVLLDINMPIMDGFETAKWIRQHHPEVRIMALSMQDKEDTLIRIVRCGARGYLLKNIHANELERALETVVEKGYYFPDWVTHKVLLNISGGENAASMHDLNDRELEFLRYAATEMTYKEISDKMNCSPRTVEGYRDNLFEKFQLKTRVGLVLYALRQQLIKLE
jgi:DNA-binding NarL/FixJ family response regulator